MKAMVAYRERVVVAAHAGDGPLLVRIFCRECGRHGDNPVGRVRKTPLGPLFQGRRWPSTKRDYRSTDMPIFQDLLLDHEQDVLSKLSLGRWSAEYFLPVVECRRHGSATVGSAELQRLVRASATYGKTQILTVRCHRDIDH